MPTIEEARTWVKERDERNRGHYKNMYGFDIREDLTKFDLVVNTDHFDFEQVKTILTNVIDTYLKGK